MRKRAAPEPAAQPPSIGYVNLKEGKFHTLAQLAATESNGDLIASGEIVEVCPVVRGAAPAAQVGAVTDKIATAYGIMWHVNAGMDAPAEVSPLAVTPERGAYEARKVLRDLLTHEQRGAGINAARAILAERAEKGDA